MSSTSNPSNGSDAVESHLTVEDAGTTTNASDLFENDTTAGRHEPADRSGSATGARPASEAPAALAASRVPRSTSDVPSDPGAPSAPSAPEAPSAPSGRTAADDDFAIGHVFDQTNGIIEGLDGDSDGTADSDAFSRAERADENPAFEAHTEAEPQRGAGVDDTRITGS